MRHLFTMDTKDYDPKGTRKFRPSVRGLIIRDGKILMIHSRKYDYYKFPGGGMEPGESMQEALCREVSEESCFSVIPESIREYGLVRKISRGGETEIFDQENFYFLCDVSDGAGQDLDDYEAEEGFAPMFVAPQTAIEVNRFHDHMGKWGLVQERECLVLERLLEEGYF